MTPEQRARFEFRLKELVWFLDRESLVRGGGLDLSCTLADGRRVKRTVTFLWLRAARAGAAVARRREPITNRSIYPWNN